MSYSSLIAKVARVGYAHGGVTEQHVAAVILRFVSVGEFRPHPRRFARALVATREEPEVRDEDCTLDPPEVAR